MVVSNHSTGLDCGLDCWTGLLHGITEFNLLTSHDLPTIRCAEFGHINCLMLL